MKNKIKTILILPTETPSDTDLTLKDIIAINSVDPRQDPMPYHYVINLSGGIMKDRRDNFPVEGHPHTIIIAYVGGLDPETSEPRDTRTPQQKTSIIFLTNQLQNRYPNASIKNQIS